jgi:hypothetical protein
MISLPPLCSSLYVLLQVLDASLADSVRRRGCQRCGGVLHRATYPRKPRGMPAGVDTEIRRLSFCCAAEGCRMRHAPPSVLFFGRKVYVSPVALLCCLGRGESCPQVFRRMRALLGVDLRTVQRWRAMWRHEIPQTDWWHRGRGLMPGSLEDSRLPGALLCHFGRLGEMSTWVAFLQWIKPLTTRSVRVV